MQKIGHGFTGQRLLILPLFTIKEMEKDDLSKELYIHSMGHFPKAGHHYCNRPNGCSEYVLIFCAKGKGWYILNGKRYFVSENQLFILPENTPHSYGADELDPWSIYWVHFKGCRAKYFSSGFSIPTTVFSHFEYRISLFDEMYNTLQKGYQKNNLLYACLTLGAFIGSFKFLGEEEHFKKDNEFGTSIIHLVTHYMNEHIDRQLKLEELSTFSGYSASHLHKLFYKTTGYAPIQYFLHIKIDRACYYLSNTTYKINQIAKILGFKDAYHFSKLFSKIKKISPNQYRKQQMKFPAAVCDEEFNP